MQNKTDLSPLVASVNLKDPELTDKIKRQQYSSRSGKENSSLIYRKFI